MLTLPPDIQEMVDTGRLAESAAYEISRLDGEQAQRELALAAEGGKLNREKIVEAVRAVIPKRNVVPRSSRVTARLDGPVDHGKRLRTAYLGRAADRAGSPQKGGTQAV